MKKIFNWKMKLSWQILMSIITVMMITVAISMFQINKLKSHLEDEALNAMESNGNSVIAMIAAQFVERYGDVQAFATNPNVVHPDIAVRTSTLNRFIKLYAGNYDLIMVTDINGKLLAVNDEAADGTKLKIEELKNKNFANESWFKAAIKKDFLEISKDMSGSFFGNVQFDPYSTMAYGTRRLGNEFSTPISDSNGNLVGVLTTRASFSWVENQFVELARIMSEKGSRFNHMSLVTKDGEILGQFDEKTIHSRKYVRPEANLLKKSTFPFSKFGKENFLKQKEQYLFSLKVKAPLMPEKIGWKLIIEEDQSLILGALAKEIQFFYALVAFTFVLSLILGYVFVKKISKDLSALADNLKSVGVQNQIMIQKVESSTNEIAQSTTEQAAAIQESASALSEINSMVLMTKESAQKALEASSESIQLVNQGKEKMSKMSESMFSLQDSNKELQVMLTIINQIYEKTGMIHDIVFKTQLLSFNASIEAARAGQHGRGFAIVAEEVGGLARLSGETAQEIENLLKSSQKKVSSSISEIESKIRTGNIVAQEAVTTFNYLADNVGMIDDQIKGITEATSQQQIGINQTQTAMVQLDSTAKKTDENTHVLVRIVDDFRHKVDLMNDSVEKFEHIIHGGKRAFDPTPSDVIESLKSPKDSSEGAEVIKMHSADHSEKMNNDDITADDPSFRSVG